MLEITMPVPGSEPGVATYMGLTPKLSALLEEASCTNCGRPRSWRLLKWRTPRRSLALPRGMRLPGKLELREKLWKELGWSPERERLGKRRELLIAQSGAPKGDVITTWMVGPLDQEEDALYFSLDVRHLAEGQVKHAYLVTWYHGTIYSNFSLLARRLALGILGK